MNIYIHTYIHKIKIFNQVCSQDLHQTPAMLETICFFCILEQFYCWHKIHRLRYFHLSMMSRDLDNTFPASS